MDKNQVLMASREVAEPMSSSACLSDGRSESKYVDFMALFTRMLRVRMEKLKMIILMRRQRSEG